MKIILKTILFLFIAALTCIFLLVIFPVMLLFGFIMSLLGHTPKTYVNMHNHNNHEPENQNWPEDESPDHQQISSDHDIIDVKAKEVKEKK